LLAAARPVSIKTEFRRDSRKREDFIAIGMRFAREVFIEMLGQLIESQPLAR
jgi:hypothetical protein